MNHTNYQEAVKEAVKPKFKGRKTVQCRVVPRYPDTAEREFARINRAYIRLLNKTLKDHLPEIMKAYKQEMRGDSREDSISDFSDKVRKQIYAMAAELEEALEKFGLHKAVEKIARIAQTTSVKEWKRAVKNTLGIDIFGDYYKGETYEQIVQQWIASNVSMIKSIPDDTLLDMEEIILDGYREGKRVGDLRKEIQDKYNLTKRKAEMLARDQISTLNAELTKEQHKDAGVRRYKWSSSKDSRVRECHQEFDGHIYSWDDPPEAWYSTKSKGIVYTGRKCAPGEDYCCRCCAIPVFEWEAVDLPMK